jgi:hypothetical protein
MSFGAHADITLEPGTYYIDGGDLTANAQAEIHGTGVTIVLTSSGAAGDIGSVHINGNSSVSLTAPSDGPFAGLVIVQDRRAPSDGTSVFNGGASMSFGGMLYFPSQGVRFNGNNDTNALACTEIIARLVTFTGDAGFTDSGCEAAGVTSPQAGGAQLAE